MAESSCNTSMAVTQEGPVDEIRQQTEVVAHVVIDVAAVNGNELVYLDPEWVNSMKGKISHEPRKIKASFSSCSISRIPPSLRHFDEKAYIPQIISIGPFHYEKRMGGLQAMEEHKWRYLRAAINRNGEDCLEQYLREIKNLEKRARETYTEEIDLDSNSFVEMMILDACFIIELFYRFSNRNKFDMADPILNLVLLPTIQTDLIMLENQIPFFILQHLFDLMNISGPPLAQMALNFFASLDTLHTMLMNYSINNSHLQCHHLLHLLHSKFIPSVENEDPKLKYLENMHSASELQEAGIKCKKGVGCGFLDIKYRDGEIEIPSIVINQMVEPIFLNLVAFEQCYPQQEPYITSYISFMDKLINSAKDVNILSQKGIILDNFGSSEHVATLFFKLGRDISINVKKNYLRSLIERIDLSTQRVWPRLRATLMRDYLNSPWAFIAFLAAVVLLVLTLFQTFFSAFPKFQLKN